MNNPGLPSGFVTFVYTDIEGSTRLVRELGDAFGPVLDRHNELLRAAIQEHNGVEVQFQGDGFLFVFADCDDAVAGCVQAQQLTVPVCPCAQSQVAGAH